MNEQDLRDCFAMFAMLGFITNGAKLERDVDDEKIASWSWSMANTMIEQRNKGEGDEQINNGIAAVAPKRTRKR